MITSCDICGGKLIDTKDIILKKGRAFSMNVKKCAKCGASFSDLYEVERVRKEINPSIFQKICRQLKNGK